MADTAGHIMLGIGVSLHPFRLLALASTPHASYTPPAPLEDGTL